MANILDKIIADKFRRVGNLLPTLFSYQQQYIINPCKSVIQMFNSLFLMHVFIKATF